MGKNEIDMPPKAASLVESMRDIGYSIESAVADLVDNSIAATSTSINIYACVQENGEPYIAIIDDGVGMNQDRLHYAMRLGSQSPREIRDPKDLGRFGLGLKTASFSQCRVLTVASFDGNVINACQWDLDYVVDEDSWKLKILDQKQIDALPRVEALKECGRGTLVVWSKLDRIMHGWSRRELHASLDTTIEIVRWHLELVFHRYLSGEEGISKIRIRINGTDLAPRDPFARGNSATQKYPDEKLIIENHTIVVKAFTLPHYSRLTREEQRRLGGEGGFLKNQGFYVYRNHRLIVHGTWFRLELIGELTKLARIMVDIPNALDHLWKIDVRKSSAWPPEIIRQELRRVLPGILGSSKRVYVHRGTRSNRDQFVHLWDRMVDNTGIAYRLNREHPLLKQLMETLEADQGHLLESLLRALEQAIPVEAIYSDMGSRPQDVSQSSIDLDSLRNIVNAMIVLFKEQGLEMPEIADRILKVEPFCRERDRTLHILEEFGG